MSSEPTIRRLTPEDADALFLLRRQALEIEPFAFSSSPADDRFSSLAFVRESLGPASPSVTFGAFAPHLIGMLGLLRQSKVKTAHRTSLWGFYVAPASRNSGVGRALLLAALAHARGMAGVTHVGLSVSERAAAARRLYEGLGFRVWGIEPAAIRWDGEDEAEFHMNLTL